MLINDPAVDMLLRGFVLTAGAMIWVVILVRLNGLRSFSKMTNFDFVMTVAVGSLLAGAGQATEWSAFGQALVAMSGLFAVQYLSARLRRSSDAIESLMQNQPTILMRDGVIDQAALSKTRVAEDDLIAKLREANVLDFADVRAVILETTGDISVLHGDSCAEQLLQGTREVEER